MKTIAVMVFDKPEGSRYEIGYVSSEDQAKQIYKELGELGKKGTVQIESGTIVVKNEEGKVKLRKTTEMTAGRGAGRGAFRRCQYCTPASKNLSGNTPTREENR